MLTIKRSAIVAMPLLLPLFACFCGALASNGNVSPRPNPRPGQVTRLSWSRQAVPSGTPSLMVTNLSTNASRLFAIGRGGGGGTSRTAAKITGHKETHSQSAKTSLLQRYSHLIDTKPLATKAWTAGIVAALADLAAQTFIDPLTTHVSLRRALTFLFTGACFVGPYLHVWYAKLDATARYLRLSSPQARTLVKVLLNESIGVCIFFPLYFVAFEVAHGLTHGQAPVWAHIADKCRFDMWSMVLMNWRIWPLANIINFGLVPSQLQVLVNQILSFFWFIYLSTRM